VGQCIFFSSDYTIVSFLIGHISLTIESDGAGKPRQSVVKLPLQAKVIPTPPRQ